MVEGERGIPRPVVVLVGAAALVVALAGVRAVSEIIGPAFLALVLTITVYPVRQRLQRWGLPGWAASVVLLLGVYLVLVLFTLALIVSLGRLAVIVPDYAPEIQDNWDSFGSWLKDLGVGDEQVAAVVDAFDVGNLVSLATDILGGILSVLGDLFFIATLALFLAFDAAPTDRVVRELQGHHTRLMDAIHSFVHGTRSYVAVSASFGLIVAVIDTFALWVMGVPGAFVWGVLAFVTNFIPNIGFVIGVVPPAVIALLEGGPGLMLAVIAVYSVINFVIQSVIQPRIVGDAVGFSATITFLSLVFWTWAIGPLGALLAVPLSLLLRALLIEADPRAAWVLPIISGKSAPPDDEVTAAPR